MANPLMDPNRPDPTVEGVAARLRFRVNKTYSQMVNAYELGMRIFWSNESFTPNELFAALGEDAARVFQLNADLRSTILSANPDQELSTPQTYGWEYTIDENGFNATPYSPPVV